MKKIYERPEIKTLEIKKEDIITLSYMLPEMLYNNTTTDTESEENSGNISQ